VGWVTRVPVISRAALTAQRALIALGYYRRPLRNLARWLLTSRERANFTYALEGTNQRYLAAMVATVAGIPFDVAHGYIREIESDQALRQHVLDVTARSDRSSEADRRVEFGRRVGWYALARAMKPRVIVETGVDKGLGACVLTAALMRNALEGRSGRYFGTDIDAGAGYLLSGPYAENGEILRGDSIESLTTFPEVIDMFVNDSDHSASYEAREYATVEGKLSPNAVILGDNAHVTDALLEFSLRTDRQFLFFQEKPADHWYPGAGIGISFRR
jgi:predicted O-methyltransferase YrrM